MIRTNRPAVGSAIAVSLLPATFMLAAPAAIAQDECPPSMGGTQIYAECVFQQNLRERRQPAQEPQPQAPVQQPIQSGGDGTAISWQLALGALAGAVAGGGVAAGTLFLRRPQPDAAH